MCKLNKSLYGLKQASKEWNLTLTKALIKQGFIQTVSDPSLFIKSIKGYFITLDVYVDDIILASDNMNAIVEIKRYLHDCFSIKDLGQFKFILGIEIARNTKGIHMYQRKYALDLLAEYGFLDCKPCSTPIPVEQQNYLTTKALEDNSHYIKLIGKLLYFSNTRPDISYAVQQLSQHLDKLHEAHMLAAHRILHYLKGKPMQGIFFSASKDTQLKAYTDSDWGDCKETKKSITDYCTFIRDSLISWKSKKQNTVL